MAFSLQTNFVFPAFRTGLSTVGFTLYASGTNTVIQARTTAGVTETATPGTYTALVSYPGPCDVGADDGGTPLRSTNREPVTDPSGGGGGSNPTNFNNGRF